MVKPEVGNIVGPSKMACSCRIFGVETKMSIERPPAKKDEELVVPSEAPMKEMVNNNNASRFLKITRKSDYCVVDQLHQIPSKFSILSLLMNS